MAAGDFDGDGRVDFVVAGRNADSMTIFYRKATGAPPYDRVVLSTSAPGAFSVKVADFNGDGRPDIVASLRDGNLVRLWLNAGSVWEWCKGRKKGCAAGLIRFFFVQHQGAFTEVTVGTAMSPRGIEVADVDRDGDWDVVVSGAGNDRVSM